MHLDLPRLRISAEIPVGRLVALLCALGCAAATFFALRYVGGSGGGPLAIIGAVLVLFAGLIGTGICLGLAARDSFASPFADFLSGIIAPREIFKAPPEDHLRALRMRLRDRQWDSVDHQLAKLEQTYGHSAELYWLRAHSAAGRTGSCGHVTCEASEILKGPAFDRYLEMLRRDPVPAAPQTDPDC